MHRRRGNSRPGSSHPAGPPLLNSPSLRRVSGLHLVLLHPSVLRLRHAAESAGDGFAGRSMRWMLPAVLQLHTFGTLADLAKNYGDFFVAPCSRVRAPAKAVAIPIHPCSALRGSYNFRSSHAPNHLPELCPAPAAHSAANQRMDCLGHRSHASFGQ